MTQPAVMAQGYPQLFFPNNRLVFWTFFWGAILGAFLARFVTGEEWGLPTGIALAHLALIGAPALRGQWKGLASRQRRFTAIGQHVGVALLLFCIWYTGRQIVERIL